MVEHVKCRLNGTYYDRYLADAGAHVYHENRQSCHAKDFHKYSRGFFKRLPKAIMSTKKHPDGHVPCTKTVYTLIDQGVLSILNID